MSHYLNKYFFTGVALGGGSTYLLQSQAQKRRFQSWDSALRETDDVTYAAKNKARHVADDVRATVNDSASRVADSGKRAIDGAKNEVGEAKNSVLGGVYGVKNAIEHTVEYTGDQLSHSHNDAKAKAEQLQRDAEKAKSSWLSWGNKKADETKDATDKKLRELERQAEDTKSSWFSRGNKKKEEAKDTYESTKQDVRSRASEAQQQAEETKSSWLSWGGEKKEETKADLQRYGEDVADRVNRNVDKGADKAKRGVDDFALWSKKQVNERPGSDKLDDEELARVNKRALAGWGDSAAEFAQDKYNEARRK